MKSLSPLKIALIVFNCDYLPSQWYFALCSPIIYSLEEKIDIDLFAMFDMFL